MNTYIRGTGALYLAQCFGRTLYVTDRPWGPSRLVSVEEARQILLRDPTSLWTSVSLKLVRTAVSELFRTASQQGQHGVATIARNALGDDHHALKQAVHTLARKWASANGLSTSDINWDFPQN